MLGKAEQALSLKEVLDQTLYTLGQDYAKRRGWKYTRKFHQKWTQKGQIDFVQGQGLM